MSQARQLYRSVYLLTYSQADLELVPDRQTFAQMTVQAFEEATPAKVIQWVCSREEHLVIGVHYHMALKLDRQQRWLGAKVYLEEHHGVIVHFSDHHFNYFSAWEYVTKEDLENVESQDHPDLSNGPPRTMAASEARCGGQDPSTESKQKRLTPFQVSQILTSKGIKTPLQLMALAKKQKDEGKTDLTDFIISKGKKRVQELIDLTWEVEAAPQTYERSKMQRLAILEAALGDECICTEEEQWYLQAMEILHNNFINPQLFARAIHTLLKDGRGKYRNIMLTGPANCGKSFLFGPVSIIFQTFSNPTNSSFAWVGVEDAEVIILNDFRWTPQTIAWNDLLLLLEGEALHLPAPKSHYSRDILMTKDTPIFCTTSHQIMMVRGGVVDERESEMMSVRWRHFSLFHQVALDAQREIRPCPKCFAKLVLQNV